MKNDINNTRCANDPKLKGDAIILLQFDGHREIFDGVCRKTWEEDMKTKKEEDDISLLSPLHAGRRRVYTKKHITKWQFVDFK